MSLRTLRIFALILTLSTALSFSGVAAAAAALLQATDAEACCGHCAPEPEEAAPSSPCASGDCPCACGSAELPPRSVVLLRVWTFSGTLLPPPPLVLRSGHGAGIDYPPEQG